MSGFFLQICVLRIRSVKNKIQKAFVSTEGVSVRSRCWPVLSDALGLLGRVLVVVSIARETRNIVVLVATLVRVGPVVMGDVVRLILCVVVVPAAWSDRLVAMDNVPTPRKTFDIVGLAVLHARLERSAAVASV